MQKIKSKRNKFLILLPFDILITSIGILIFKIFKKTYNFFYQSMVRLFCVTGGKSNNYIDYFTSNKEKLNLNDKKLLNLDKIINEIEDTGFYIYDNFLSEQNCEDIFKYCLKNKLEIRPDEDQNWDDEKQYLYFNSEKPEAVMYEMPKNKVLSNELISKIIFSDEILKICEKYFKSKPIFDHASLSISTSFSKIANNKAAQLFHFDLDRPKWLKFLFYINDVNENNGPHVFVPGTHRNSGIDRSILSQGYSRISDEIVFEKYKEIKYFTKKKRTLIIEDTRGLHKGSVVKSGYRCLLNIQFNSSNYGTKINKQLIPKNNVNIDIFEKNLYTYQNLNLKDQNEL